MAKTTMIEDDASVHRGETPDGCLRIEGEMTIYQAVELKETLLSALKGASTLEIDLHGVTEIDSAGVQLLMMAKREAHARGGKLRLSRHSPAVLDVFQMMDLAAHFGDSLLMPA